MADIKNPTALSDYDWLELVGFVRKVAHEGYEYAAEEYAPTFETPTLQQRADDESGLRALYREHGGKVDAWAEAVGWETAGDLHDAHVDEARMRSESDRLWAVHPGGDWNTRPYMQAFHSRKEAEAWIEGRHKLVEQGWKPWSGHLLRRDTPGGEWEQGAAPMSTPTVARSQAEIFARIESADDMFGWDREVLLPYLDFEHAKPILVDGVTPEQWAEHADDPAKVAGAARDYHLFALGKIAAERGISAERSVVKLREYAWLMGRDDVVAAMDAAPYPQYGAPKVAAFAAGLGFDTDAS